MTAVRSRIAVVVLTAVHAAGCQSEPIDELPPPSEDALLPDLPANPVFSPMRPANSAAPLPAVPRSRPEGSAVLASSPLPPTPEPRAADGLDEPGELSRGDDETTTDAATSTTATAKSASAVEDLVEQSFHDDLESLEIVLEALERGKRLDDFELLRKSELDKRLIAHFFLKKDRDLAAYRRLVDSLSQESPIVSLEILKAAFFEELGMTEQRDRALERLPQPALGPTPAGSFAVRRFSLVRYYGGRQGDVVPLEAPFVFGPGQDVQLYGEFSGFRSVVVRGRHRRSFTACLSLSDANGELIGRRTPFLVAGKAREDVADPAQPVHFHGHYRVPASLTPGSYRLEMLALDVEAEATTKAEIRFEVK